MEKSKSTKAKKITTLITVLLMAILIGLLLFNHNKPSDLANLESTIKAELGQLENKSNEEIQAALNEVVDEGSLSVSINMNPVFPTGDTAGSLQIENGPQNLYGQRVVITLNDTGEQIYDSGYMPINSHIQEDTLDVDLNAGTYDANVVFTALDESTGNEVGQVISKIKITVLN